MLATLEYHSIPVCPVTSVNLPNETNLFLNVRQSRTLVSLVDRSLAKHLRYRFPWRSMTILAGVHSSKLITTTTTTTTTASTVRRRRAWRAMSTARTGRRDVDDDPVLRRANSVSGPSLVPFRRRLSAATVMAHSLLGYATRPAASHGI